MVLAPKNPGPKVEQAYVSNVSLRDIAMVSSTVPKVTRIKLSPDERYMFVASLDGTLRVLVRNEAGKYVMQPTPLHFLNLGWAEGAENGLTGIIVSYAFPTSQYVFLTYAQKLPNGQGENQVLRLIIEEKEDGEVVATNPTVIFRGNTPVAGAHQIQGGISVRVEDKPHLLFAMGDAYHAEYARDLSREAGKLMLITEDGDNPLGSRPYPLFPKIQAIGIRNAYDIAKDPAKDYVVFTDNGPEANDRLIRGPILDGTKQFDFGWNGKPESLIDDVSVGGREDEPVPNPLVHVWKTTVAPTDVVVDSLSRIYVNIFSSSNYPNKEIMMGEVRDGKFSLTPIVTRSQKAEGGNLLGLTLSENGNFYFGDFFDGKVYVLGRLWEIGRVRE